MPLCANRRNATKWSTFVISIKEKQKKADRRKVCPLRLCLATAAAVVVKCGVADIEVSAVQSVGGKTQRFTESLEVYDFPLAQELDRFTYFRIVYQTQNVWVEGRYVDTVQPNGAVLRTWQPGHYEQRTVQIQ